MQYKKKMYTLLVIILFYLSSFSIVFSNTDSTLASLKKIYKALDGIELIDKKSQPDRTSYKLPYYKMNADESMYYNTFTNGSNLVYKTQFIYYRNGFEFSAKEIPQLKEIIELVTNDKNYPIEKLSVQFNHLKENISKKPDAEKTSHSSWDYGRFRTVMDVEHYQTRNQTRIKITIYLVKK